MKRLRSGVRVFKPQSEIRNPMPPRILVLSASVGAGHMRAAQAVELALRELAPEAEVRNVDVLTLTNAAFRKLYAQAYLDLVNKAPYVLGYIYDLLDKPSNANSKGDRFRLALQKINLRQFAKLLAEGWDMVVNTHFLPAEIIASQRRDGNSQQVQITATTDFETHRLWVNEPCDIYCTATAEGAAYLQSFGVPREKLRVTGIPIHPAFSKPLDRNNALAAHSLANDRPVVLQLSGGFGVGPIGQLFSALLQIEVPLQIVAVAGKNADAKAELEAMPVPDRHRVKVMGFTDKIDELMAAADVVLSKPGGLTTSEVLARGAAMAIINPIPGQESRNSDFLLENGAAIKINNVGTMSMKLTELLGNAERLAALRANAKRIGKPQAAFDVARIALDFINQDS